MRRRWVWVLAVCFAALPASAAHASRLTTIETPSRHVDPKTSAMAGGGPADALRASVLLPDGYDGRRRFPVLYLVHPTNGDHRSWTRPEEGNIRTLARGLRAIVVMPDAGLGFLSNWWNGGRRCCPAWERYFLGELPALVARRFRVRPGRRWHAIGGFSMGGGGAAFLAGQRPDYFGSAISLLGTTLSIQRPYTESAFPLATAFPSAIITYDQIWGPSRGAYATGHNPLALVDNLAHTRLFVSAGDGVPRAGAPMPPAGPVAAAFLAAIEVEVRQQAEEFVPAARAAGVQVDYVPHRGIHDWPYVREDLATAIRRGLFPAVPAAPRRWTYRTVARRGRAWDLRYRFAAPPETLQVLRRRGRVLRGEGTGAVTITTKRGCRVTAGLPFRRRLPAGFC